MSSARLPDPGKPRPRASGKLPPGSRPSGTFRMPEVPARTPARTPATSSPRGGRRLRRWALPASVIALAVAAIGSLATSVLFEESLRQAVHPRRAVTVASSLPTAPRPQIALEAPRAAPAAHPVPTAALLRPVELPSVHAPALVHVEAPAPALAASGSDAAALGRAPSLPERWKVLDEIAARPGDAALAALETLLAAELPGSAYEAGTLRLAILGKVAHVPGARADAVLVAHLEATLPRPERLGALEALSGRPNAGRPAIEAIASSDQDAAVQEKARTILARDH